MKAKISLDTLERVNAFVTVTSAVKCPVYLVGDNLKVSAKSLLGALYTMEWGEVWCECECDIYQLISEFVVD